MLPQLLEVYDANKNGLFDPEERAQWRRDQARKPSGAPRRWDKNGDGVIDAVERADARAWFKGQGTSDATPPVSTNAPAISSVERKRLRDQHNQDLVRRFDKNGDGELDNDERNALWAEYKAKVRARQAAEAQSREP
jgi:Ca2+-binding EF-hand superfamily protein